VRSIPDPGFGGDAGEADPAVTDALQSYTVDGVSAPVIQVLLGSRLLVPVVSMPTAAPGNDHRAEMAAVMIRGTDGRTAQLAFTSVAAMRSWDDTARPVPLPCREVARGALEQGAEAVVVDIRDSCVVLETDVLRHAAVGHQLVRDGALFAWVVPVRAERREG
jgi:SseB protein N-terminal domain